MAIDLKQLKMSKAKAPRILIHGGEGVGKTTFACGAPAPVVIDLEAGLGTLEVPHVRPDTYTDVLDMIQSLTDQEHNFKSVIIDSLDALESMITTETCREKGWTSIAQKKWGEGYSERSAMWAPFWTALDRLRDTRNMIIILVAHSHVEKVEDPMLPTFDKMTLNLYKKETAKAIEWPDVVGYAKIVTYTRTEGERNLAATAGERVLLTTSNPAYTAKTRYPMPEEMPLQWSEFVQYLRTPTPTKEEN
jgi:hypothetical protein